MFFFFFFASPGGGELSLSSYPRVENRPPKKEKMTNPWGMPGGMVTVGNEPCITSRLFRRLILNLRCLQTSFYMYMIILCQQTEFKKIRVHHLLFFFLFCFFFKNTTAYFVTCIEICSNSLVYTRNLNSYRLCRDAAAFVLSVRPTDNESERGLVI